MASAAKGWYSTTDSKWLRWWDGKAWSDAYWPTRPAKDDYLPTAERVDISSAWASVDIVGENYREAAIARAIGGQSPRDVEVTRNVTAELVPEPDNPHSRNGKAISVRINGDVVGYLPDESAADYWDIICRFIGSWQVPTVRADVWAVTRWVASRSRDELKASIRLALPAPDQILPENEIPSAPHRVLPIGRAVQVTGEEQHLEQITPYCRDGEASQVVVSLHPLTVQRAKSEVTVVEVHLDGERIGQLTPATSVPILKLIDEVEREGLVTVAWARVKGSRFAAEVSVLLQKPEDIPSSWPSPSDVLPKVGQFYRPPAAWRDEAPLPEPPAGMGLPWWGWTLVIVGALLLAQIPAVGPVLLFLAVGAGVWWHIVWRRKPSPKAKRGVTLAV